MKNDRNCLLLAYVAFSTIAAAFLYFIVFPRRAKPISDKIKHATNTGISKTSEWFEQYKDKRFVIKIGEVANEKSGKTKDAIEKEWKMIEDAYKSLPK